MADPSAASSSGTSTQPTKKRGRSATRMIELALTDVKKPIDFDPRTKLPIGENRKKFKSHVGSIARNKVCILVDDWDHVDVKVKDMIWDDIMLKWDIRDTDIEKLKDKWISYAGERWRAFKTSLTRRYLNGGKLSHKSPLETYSFLDEETWQGFIKTREDPSFLEKRKRGKMVQAYNKYHHIMSRGGYELIEEKMMQEKIKQRQESAGEALPTPPSPPKRHEKWLRGRKRPSGEFTSEETRLVADNIKLAFFSFIVISIVNLTMLCCQVKLLRVSILRIWVVYMKQLCTQLDKSNMYGFIDPNFIQPQNDRVGSQSYITDKLVENEKDFFFVPYLNNHHWQLLIIEPKKQNVIFLCSMGLKPDKNIVLIVDSAINSYKMLKGSRKQRKPTWNIILTCQRQSFSYESGYYVMIHMLNIVSAGIVNSWNQVFGDSTPFDEDEVSNIQERCANSILEFAPLIVVCQLSFCNMEDFDLVSAAL
ncbi:hypothetical protein QL285_056518 [Trifolium repens]|nr:hypothetical protein QL285_056518 [Trifolium repens]